MNNVLDATSAFAENANCYLHNTMSENTRTDFLTPTSTFVIGMGTVLNLAGNYFVYNTSGTPDEADANAIASDWQMVGRDIRQAIQKSESSAE